MSRIYLILLLISGLTVCTYALDESIGWWPLDGSAQDISGNGNDLQVSGGADFVEGYFGQAVSFDGIDGNGDSVRSGGDIDLLDPGSDSFTVTAWLKLGQGTFSQNYNFVVSKGNPTSSAVGWSIWNSNSNGALVARCNSSDTSAQRAAQQQLAVPLDEWLHVAMVIDREAAQVRGYTNGSNEGWIPGGGGPTSDSLSGWGDIANDLPLVIGHRNDGTGTLLGVVDDLRIYTGVLTEADIQQVMAGTSPGLASNASPADEASDVLLDVILSWEPGEFADQHDVYFGTVFDDVNNATTTVDPAGAYMGRQSQSTYAPGRLDLDQTYYWRIDEVNAAPDYTVFKGNVWSFTVEPVGYPIENITATASSEVRANEGPENTINGSGLDDDDLHSAENSDMWLSSVAGPDGTWIQYEFDRAYKLYQMRVWNYSSSVEPVVGFGIKEATIEYSTDGVNWATLGTTHEFARGIGADGYAPNTTVDPGGVAAKYVKITANSNWGGMVNQYGLSEVRFLYVPVLATEPSPDSGATDVDVDVTLSFRAGREAAKHDVYLGADEQAVIDGTAPVATVTEPSYASSLDLASTYYWRIDEANDAETPTAWQGDIWNLSTQEYLVVDDFESYNDIPDGEEGSNLVYVAWVDGFGNPSTNGSTMGYVSGASLDSSNVHGGNKSVPLAYNNTSAGVSEVVRTLTPAQDWTTHGVKTLSLWFAGDGANVPGQLYVKVNGVQINYGADAGNLALAGWQTWNIDLTAINTNLSNITSLAIGIQGPGATGTLLLDDIRLYSYDRQLIAPADPGTAGLQAHYEFEGNTNDSSGNARHGTGIGTTFVAGKIGQAIGLDGLDYVEITGYKGILGSNAITVTAWIKTVGTDTGAIVGWGTGVSGQRFGFRVDIGRLRAEHHGGNVQGDSNVNDGAWHHVAVAVQENATISYPEVILYLDGQDDTRPTTDPDAFDITAEKDVNIGRRPASNDRLFLGQIDDVRIYDRALTQEEITWLSGRIKPFDKPF